MMHAPRPVLILLCALLLSACARTAAGPRAVEADDTAVSIAVDNQSRMNLLVYLGRPGERGTKLGSINALDKRTFRLQSLAWHTEVYLYATPLAREAHVLRGYEALAQHQDGVQVPHVSAPFLASEATSVRWTVRDGQRLSGVTLR